MAPKNLWFPNFAKYTASAAGKPATFAVAVLSIIIWAVLGPIFGYSDTWQLVINTATTIVTFLLVALLQNSQRRSEQAIHQKLDALADGLADLMEHMSEDDADVRRDIRDLHSTVGAERTD